MTPRWLKIDIVDAQDNVFAEMAADVRWDYGHSQGPGIKVTEEQARGLLKTLTLLVSYTKDHLRAALAHAEWGDAEDVLAELDPSKDTYSRREIRRALDVLSCDGMLTDEVMEAL